MKCLGTKTLSSSALLPKFMGIPRYQNFHACPQLLSAHLLVKETQRLRPNFNTLAYIGAKAENFFAENSPAINSNVEELFLMDCDMEMNAKNHYNLSNMLTDAQKWFIQ